MSHVHEFPTRTAEAECRCGVKLVDLWPNGAPPLPRSRNADGFLHFSELKAFAQSAYHYRYACNRLDPKETDPMRIGDLFDRMIYPGSKRDFVVYEGRRQGKKWEDFEAQAKASGCDIFTTHEYQSAKGAADELLYGPTGEAARAYFVGAQCQVPLRWRAFGFDCAAGIIEGDEKRGGMDLYRPRRWIADTKLTTCTEPLWLARHARKQLWPQQLVWYSEAVEPVDELVLIGVEATPPHVVSVLRLTPAMIERAYKSLVMWTESLRRCEESGRFPGYSDAVQPLDVDPWEKEDGDD